MQESRYNIWIERADAAYVFNGVSGALLRLSLPEYVTFKRWIAGEVETCTPATLACLAEGMMLIPDGTDERVLLAQRYQTSRYDTSRFALTLVTSLGCNFDCPYCFEAKHPSIMDNTVRALVLDAVADQLLKVKSFRVNWYGGEPLVGKAALLSLSDEFIARSERAGVSYRAQITTNGYLLTHETSAQLRARHITSAQVCLDGPPAVHDKMRPLVNGKGTFWQIVENLHHAIEYLSISVRVNIDRENFPHAEKLLAILAEEGFAGKLSVYAAQIVTGDQAASAPAATYKGHCFTNAAFAHAELQFATLAKQYGFPAHSLPGPVGAPCTAVRANELVVGSKGELYKCWESVGNQLEVIGHISDYKSPNGRLQKWLKYEPFADDECMSCIALPVCMGGCAQHAMDSLQYENRCGTFRHTYREQVARFVESDETESSHTDRRLTLV